MPVGSFIPPSHLRVLPGPAFLDKLAAIELYRRTFGAVAIIRRGMEAMYAGA